MAYPVGRRNGRGGGRMGRYARQGAWGLNARNVRAAQALGRGARNLYNRYMGSGSAPTHPTPVNKFAGSCGPKAQEAMTFTLKENLSVVIGTAAASAAFSSTNELTINKYATVLKTYTDRWDQYRIVKVVETYKCRETDADLDGKGVYLCTLKDNDDQNAMLDWTNTVLPQNERRRNDGGFKKHKGNFHQTANVDLGGGKDKYYTFTYKPCTRNGVNGESRGNAWIGSANTSAPHYGLKHGFELDRIQLTDAVLFYERTRVITIEVKGKRQAV